MPRGLHARFCHAFLVDKKQIASRPTPTIVVDYTSVNHKLDSFIQGGPKKVRPLRLMAHIFCLRLQNARTNFRYFGTLNSMPFLNTSVDSKLIKFIVQSGARCEKLTTQISLATTLRVVQHKMCNRISLDKIVE